jgi:3-deoxy-7-phosphoheptulonate synthase
LLLVLKQNLKSEVVADICDHLHRLEIEFQRIDQNEQVTLVITSEVANLPLHTFSQLHGVEKVVAEGARVPLVSSRRIDAPRHSDALWLKLKRKIKPIVIAGPCSVESEEQILQLAKEVKQAGATMLRGGAFKPRTSPYDFCGLGEEALKYMRHAKELTGLPTVSEVMSAEQVEQALPYVDVLQIGTRNMYNYELLKVVGRTDKVIMLKRAMSATVDELLQAAEYILLEGNDRVVLCERGIRTYETSTRNTLDLSCVPILKALSDFPVIVDPSHGTGRQDLIRPMSRAAIACGADGVMIETHFDPEHSISDAAQAITPAMLKEIVVDINSIAEALNDRESTDSQRNPMDTNGRHHLCTANSQA